MTCKRARKHARGGSLNPDKNGETFTKAETVVAVSYTLCFHYHVFGVVLKILLHENRRQLEK